MTGSLKKVSVDLTGHTYDGRCKRLVNDAINVLVLFEIKKSFRIRFVGFAI